MDKLHTVKVDDGNGNVMLGQTPTNPEHVGDGAEVYVFIFADKDNGFEIPVGEVKGRTLKHRVSDGVFVG